MAREVSNSAAQGGDNTIRERVQELTWALVDDQINTDEMQLLDSLLLSDDGARGTYLDCMQLHTDLMFHFAGGKLPVGDGAKSPVLGFLGDAVPPASVSPPVT
jgi:hypothetical protein